jgi:PAS domain S-box-containing protein
MSAKMNEHYPAIPPSRHRSRDDAFLDGAGEMGVLVRSIDWRDTPFGPIVEWPQSLRTTMSICLSSRFPIAVYWGPEFLMLYNESLIPMVGSKKHPHALGQSARVVLAEIWGIIEPLLEHVRTTGEATWSEDLMLPLARTGAPEESYFTFTYSPIRDETGGVGGVFCAAVETTEKVIEGRRLRLLNALAAATRASTPAKACERAATEIARATDDVPFAILYLLDEAGVATLTGAANIDAGSALAPLTLRPGEEGPWPLFNLDVNLDSEARAVPLALGPGGARGAVLLPIEHSGGGKRFGFVIAGLSPMLSQSASYTRFHKLLAASISQGVSSAAAYEQERQRAEALAELDRAKTAFFSNVSHEFRTPLTLMLGPAEDALADADLSMEERERWSIVQRSALRLSKLVNTLLDFSRIEAGRVEASYEPTDLSAFTGELASIFRSAIERAGLNLRLDLAVCAEPAYVDREMWEKIVLNLLSNALKFTFEGEIAVSLLGLEDGFELVVRDTGIGIAPQALPKVFDRFHRIKGVRARTHEGTGIGLALVVELAKLHGGNVSVESAEGRGTAFHVRVPRGSRHLPSDRIGAPRALASTAMGAAPYVEEALRWTSSGTAQSLAPAEAIGAPASAGSRARIVLADDNADMRQYLTRLLSERWDVQAVPDGAAALAAIRQSRPDLVLSDVMMPGLDGFGLLAAVRGDPALRLTPVILLSARASEDESAEGLNAGANDYIVKPFSARELLVRVASNLATARAAHAAARELSELLSQAEASERQFRELVENLPELAWTARPDGFVDYYNRRWYEYTGTSLDEMQGWGWSTLHDPEKSGAVKERWQHSIDTGEPFEMEFPLRGADGVFRWFLTRVRPLRDAAGRIVRWFGSSTNIDERRRNEDFRETFVGILGHDLRNPLSTILTTSRVLTMLDTTPAAIKKRLERVTTSGVRIQRMIDQLLDLTRARLANGIPVRLSEHPIDLGPLVARIIDEVSTAKPHVSIQLQVDGDCSARVDADRFEQVVSNLVGNAVTHGDATRPIVVALAAQSTAVSMTVHNYGEPVPAEFLPLLFNPFARAEKPTGPSAGLGLGLYVSERIVDAHRGRLSVRSSAETGTRFEAILPRSPQ